MKFLKSGNQNLRRANLKNEISKIRKSKKSPAISFLELAKKIKTKKLQGDFLALQFFERADIKNLNFFFVCSQ